MIFRHWILVSAYEKRSNKSSSPAPPTTATTSTSQRLSPLTVVTTHNTLQSPSITTNTTLIESTSISFPTANSLDLSSDELLLNATASSTATTTTTTSSSFMDSTRLLSFDESSLVDYTPDVDMDQDGATSSQPWTSRYRMEQRKNSVTGVAGAMVSKSSSFTSGFTNFSTSRTPPNMHQSSPKAAANRHPTPVSCKQ